jgi:hypothetical protein
MLKKYLGFSDVEIKENEQMWREEMGKSTAPSASGSDLRNVGVTPGAISGDLDTLSAVEPPPEAGAIPGAEGGLPGAGAIAGAVPTPGTAAAGPSPALGTTPAT